MRTDNPQSLLWQHAPPLPVECRGRLPNAECDSVFVYLSNLPDISFEQAAKASGLSSDTADYFAVEDAVLVELRTE